MDAVQRLRAKAQAQGNLKSTTAAVAGSMRQFNPDASWKKV
jgi:hypothetical protein